MKMKQCMVFIYLAMIFFSTNLYAGGPCDALSSGVHSSPYDASNYYIASANNLTFTIPLTNYSAYITAALSGAPLPTSTGTTLSVEACASLSESPTQFTQANVTNVQVFFAVFGTSWNGGTVDDFSTVNVPLQSEPTYAIGARLLGYCPCGFNNYNGSTCQEWFTPQNNPPPGELMLNGKWMANYYMNGTINPGNGIGLCYNIGTVGALFFSIYAPPGQIPPVGTYQTQIQVGLGPQS